MNFRHAKACRSLGLGSESDAENGCRSDQEARRGMLIRQLPRVAGRCGQIDQHGYRNAIATRGRTGAATTWAGSWLGSFRTSIWQHPCFAISPHLPCICWQQSWSVRVIFGAAVQARNGISREIADRHHGILNVRSREGEDASGTFFSLFLPHDAGAR